MIITRFTTDEELKAPLVRTKELLAANLAGDPDRFDSEALTNSANHIAALEGEWQARIELRNALTHGVTYWEARKHLTSVVLWPVGDTTSGRTNDCRRAKHEGLRQEIQRLLSQLDRGEFNTWLRSEA